MENPHEFKGIKPLREFVLVEAKPKTNKLDIVLINNNEKPKAELTELFVLAYGDSVNKDVPVEHQIQIGQQVYTRPGTPFIIVPDLKHPIEGAKYALIDVFSIVGIVDKTKLPK